MPLDWQVKNIMSKKVILFIVEGITDEISIGHIVTKLNNDDKVYFQVVNRDITSDEHSNVTNILNKIYEQIKFYDKPERFIEFIKNNEYALDKEYKKTWEFIKTDNNSLKRFTNFNLFFGD